MKKGQASKTAENVAGFRALESFKPTNERVLDDPYAVQFLSGIYSTIAKSRSLISSRLLVKIMNWYISSFIPGGINFDIVKARYIEDYLHQCIEDGIEQLVLLGAGYDSRAFRFKALKEKVKVFEVDHPDSQRVKKEKVKRIFGYLPDYVFYVSVDFDNDKLDEKLFEGGYAVNLKTLFICEGVIYYLTAETVDETLAFIANNSGEGSSVIFDYTYESFIAGRVKEAEKMIRKAAQLGEPLTFGIEEGTVEEFLGKRGFYQVKDMKAQSLDNIYFKGTNRKSSPCWAVVHATVKQREQIPLLRIPSYPVIISHSLPIK
jgi:methyltransferase (TIGR00027 family)